MPCVCTFCLSILGARCARVCVCGCVCGGGADKYKGQGPASVPHLWPPMASPKGHTRGAPVAVAMHTNEQPPANAYAHHNTITKAIFHGAQGCTSTRHAQRQACHVQVPFPLAMSMHPCHAQGRLGATPKPATSNMHAPQCISQATRVNPQGLPPSIDQPFSTTKMGWLVLPIVLWRH